MKQGRTAVSLRAKHDNLPRVAWKQMTIRVPAEVHTALKVRAAEDRKSMGEIIEGLVRAYLVKGAKP